MPSEQEFLDFVRLLERRPEWRAELRRLLLADELLTIPQRVEGALLQLTQRVDQLAEAQRRTEERLAELAQALAQLTQRVDRLIDVQFAMGRDLERLKGSDLERRYRDRAPAYFGRLLSRIHVLSAEELSAMLDIAVEKGQLSPEETDQLLWADVVARGRRREDRADVYLVVEVSVGVGLEDIRRAEERAALLARTGATALPVVAGEWVTPEADAMARARGIWQVTDGRVIPPGQPSVGGGS